MSPSVLSNAARYGHLLADLFRLRRRIAHPISICLSVDFDPWHDVIWTEGYDILERLFRRRGLTGKVTYLINPILGLEKNEDIYRRIHDNGNEIGLHSHLERPVLEEDEGRLGTEIARQQQSVESFYARLDAQFRVRSFRSGSRAHSRALFRVLRRQGIRYDSTLSHLDRVRSVYQFTVDDRGTPRRVYYLDPEDYKAEAPAPRELVELPVTSQIPELRKMLGALRPGEPLIVATFVHPYNFARDGRRFPAFTSFYRFVLSCLTRIPDARFEHLGEAGRRWEGWAAARSPADGPKTDFGNPQPRPSATKLQSST